MPHPCLSRTGYSLIEMMITIAILAIMASIAIPLYNGYITEGHQASMRTTLNGLRTPLEDYRLENGDYGSGVMTGVDNIAAQHASCSTCSGPYDWEPSGDMRAYTYVVSVTGTNSYDVWGYFNSNNNIWVRCDNRFGNCCDSESNSGSTFSSACP